MVPTVDPVPAATPPGGTRPIIDHLPWLTSPAAAAPPPPAPPAPPAPVEPAAATITLPVAPAQPGGWVPGAPPAPVSRTYTPYAVPLSPVTAALPEPQPEPEREPTPEPAPEQEPEPAPEPELTQVLAGAATVVLPAVTAYRPVDPADDPEAFDATVDRSTLWGAEVPHAPSGVSVLAVLCPAGHVSPPHASTCRTCGRDVPAQEPFSTPRPPLGVLRLSTGDLVTLDRGVLLGRAPQVDPDQPVAQRPHVVRVASPQRDVSRTHLEVVLEGWHVLVRDLATTNGTTVTLPGREPLRLLPHDQQVIEPGTLVSLADEVTFTFEIAG